MRDAPFLQPLELERQRNQQLDEAWALRENARAERHHDVLCVALDRILSAAIQREIAVDVTACVAAARLYADTAYPPPKDTP